MNLLRLFIACVLLSLFFGCVHSRERISAPCKPFTIVAFGDSTTAPRGTLVVYSEHLKKALFAQGIDSNVINSGKGGDTTALARTRFNEDVLTHKPDLVIIQFGINDSSVEVWKQPAASRPVVELADYSANMRYFIRELKARGVSVILMTPNPVCWTDQLKQLYGKSPYDVNDADGLNSFLKLYAEEVRRIWRDESVDSVDVYAVFKAYADENGKSLGDLLLDGMHPNDKGHELISELLLKRNWNLYLVNDKTFHSKNYNY